MDNFDSEYAGIAFEETARVQEIMAGNPAHTKRAALQVGNDRAAKITKRNAGNPARIETSSEE